MGLFVLIDCNNFYVSCERVFNPQLEGKPVIILSNNDGCVVARSKEAKELGIAMAVPFFQVKDLCNRNGVIVQSSNYQLYGTFSQRVMNILASYGLAMEVYSIDEAFLQYSAQTPYNQVFIESVEIQKKIRQWLGIPVSIGIGPTKTIAKAANTLAKKGHGYNGICDLSSVESQKRILRDYPVSDVWGIGSKSAKSLSLVGISTVFEYVNSDRQQIRKLLGVSGEVIFHELRGESCIPVETRLSRKNIICSRSFGRAVSSLEEVYQAISTYAFRACEKLRDQNSVTNSICVYLQSLEEWNGQRYRVYSITLHLPSPTHSTSAVIAAAKRGIGALFSPARRYKKCGIALLNLMSEESSASDLFLFEGEEKKKKIGAVVDQINRKYGSSKLFYAAMGVRSSAACPSWQMRCEKRSPRYTTVWSDLALAYAR